MKKYYLTISQQPVPDGLRLTSYQNPGDSPILSYGETRFPIVPVIFNTVKPGEDIRIFAVKPENPNTDHWYAELKKELDALKEKKQFTYEMKPIDTPDSELVGDHLRLFGKLTDTAEDDDVIYADITYGTKPLPMIMLMFTNFAYRYKQNVDIEAIVYGAFNHNTKTSSLYDVSALFYMNSTVNQLGTVSDPKKVLDMLLALNDTGGDENE